MIDACFFWQLLFGFIRLSFSDLFIRLILPSLVNRFLISFDCLFFDIFLRFDAFFFCQLIFDFINFFPFASCFFCQPFVGLTLFSLFNRFFLPFAFLSTFF
jgi:hypothetical protein